MSLKELTLGASTYVPTSPLTGLSGKTMLRLKNMILTGQSPDIYLQAYKGSLDMSETIAVDALTGTLDGLLGQTSIVGTGTAFTTELRSGQRFWLGHDPLMVDKVVDDENITVYTPLTADAVAATGYRLPVLYDIDRQRGTQTQGNALQLDRGSILAAGWGTVRINGDVLPGTSMVLSGSPKIAYFNSVTNTYAVEDVGFPTPTGTPVLTSVAGGTKGMQPGLRSLRFVPSSTITQGYSNPNPPVQVDIAATGDRIQVDVSGFPFTGSSDQWDVYGTQFGVVNVNEGPWNFIRSVPASEIVGNIFYIEYLNGEIARRGELEFDNDPPPDAGFVSTLQGNPQWISCYGKWSSSPGPSLVPAVPQNIEGAPAIWNVTSSPPEDILGCVTSLARLYLLCAKTLQQGVYAPTGDPLVPPTQIRPYWSMGFGNPYQLIFVLGLLIGYSTAGGPTRSTADAERSDDQFIGADVIEITKDTIASNWMTAYDPDNLVNAVCFFYPAWSTNDSGWLTTRVLIWGLNQLQWIGDVIIESATRDMVVCGVATVDNALYFLAGGRGDGIGTIQIDTFLWNEIAGDAVDYYAAWELQAFDVLDRNKTVRAMRASGKFTNGAFQLYGFDSNEDVNLTNLELGANPQIEISLGTSTGTETTFRHPFNAPNNFMVSAKILGTYNGVDTDVDRINGTVLEWMPMGVRR